MCKYNKRQLAVKREFQRKYRKTEKYKKYLKLYCAKDEVKRRRHLNQQRYLKNNPWSKILNGIRSRCNNPRSPAYKWYGAKGIKSNITGEQIKFLWSRDNAANMKCPSVDRIDPGKSYELSNCRIIERSENTSRAIQRCLRLGILKRGELHKNAKLKNSDVLKIRNFHQNGLYTYSQLGHMFNVGNTTIGRIIHRQSWKHLGVSF